MGVREVKTRMERVKSMSVEAITDNIQSKVVQSLTARYDVLGESTEKTMEYAAKQPKLVAPLFQAIGVGHAVDMTV